MRTIRELLTIEPKVYLYFDSAKTIELFKEIALKENIIFASGNLITEQQVGEIMVLNKNGTIHYPGFCGTMLFGSTHLSITRIHFSKWINGDDDYIITNPYELRRK